MKKIKNTSILQGAESYSNFSNKEKGVLCIHGFVGNPAEMIYFAKRLESAGFSVSVPRLPGHGTSIEDMAATTAHDWHLAAREAYLEMQARCRKVYIAGHSMGGILTILLADEFSPERIALLSTPCDVPAPAWQKYALPLYGRIFKILPNGNPTMGINWEESRRTHISYSEGIPTLKIWDLFRITKKGMKTLPQIHAPAIIMQSTGDEAIPQKSAAVIMKRIGSAIKELHMFEKSNHVMVRDFDRDAVADRVIAFFS